MVVVWFYPHGRRLPRAVAGVWDDGQYRMSALSMPLPGRAANRCEAWDRASLARCARRGWWVATPGHSFTGATTQGATDAFTMLAAAAPRSARRIPERACV